jgi:hypothetical protein
MGPHAILGRSELRSKRRPKWASKQPWKAPSACKHAAPEGPGSEGLAVAGTACGVVIPCLLAGSSEEILGWLQVVVQRLLHLWHLR